MLGRRTALVVRCRRASCSPTPPTRVAGLAGAGALAPRVRLASASSSAPPAMAAQVAVSKRIGALAEATGTKAWFCGLICGATWACGAGAAMGAYPTDPLRGTVGEV